MVASFDRTGFLRHQRRFEPLQPRTLTGPVLVTGGTAGIGLAAARAMAAHGAACLLWGRNPERGAAAAASVADSTFVSVDLSDLDAVAKAAADLPENLSTVVLNAGSMPLERMLSPQGHERMWASQVLGHLLVLRVLHQRGVLAGTRVIWVSSGGMYLQRLDLRDLRWDRSYARHTAYANAKRAQVMLSAHLATRWPGTWMGAMHPGWVDTAAVRHSMPVFHRLTSPVLRTPAQGADTIAWLALEQAALPTGRFWFDRADVPEHLNRRTQKSAQDLDALVQAVWQATDPFLP